MKKYQVLLILGVMFLLPIVIAKVMLAQHWYTGGVTNRGQLITPPITVNKLAEPGKWKLLYWLPTHCDKRCESALFHLRQIPIAVGAEQQRVNSVVLLASTMQSDTSLPLLAGIERYNSGVSEHRLFESSAYGANAVYIVDPHGNVMLAYPLVSEKTAMLAQGKEILHDLKRLLKVSKIG